jgi:hypothetical protein
MRGPSGAARVHGGLGGAARVDGGPRRRGHEGATARVHSGPRWRRMRRMRPCQKGAHQSTSGGGEVPRWR